MSSRIESAFAKLKQQSRSALVTYITAGDPSPTASLPYMQALVEATEDRQRWDQALEQAESIFETEYALFNFLGDTVLRDAAT